MELSEVGLFMVILAMLPILSSNAAFSAISSPPSSALADCRTLLNFKTTAKMSPSDGYVLPCPAGRGKLPSPAILTAAKESPLPGYFTVWSNVFERGGLKPGENFLVHGGAGGIGYTAIQLAKAFGAKVFKEGVSSLHRAFFHVVISIHHRNTFSINLGEAT